MNDMVGHGCRKNGGVAVEQLAGVDCGKREKEKGKRKTV